MMAPNPNRKIHSLMCLGLLNCWRVRMLAPQRWWVRQSTSQKWSKSKILLRSQATTRRRLVTTFRPLKTSYIRCVKLVFSRNFSVQVIRNSLAWNYCLTNCIRRWRNTFFKNRVWKKITKCIYRRCMRWSCSNCTKSSFLTKNRRKLNSSFKWNWIWCKIKSPPPIIFLRRLTWILLRWSSRGNWRFDSSQKFRKLKHRGQNWFRLEKRSKLSNIRLSCAWANKFVLMTWWHCCLTCS